MKTDHSFVPERALANHCAELFPREQSGAEQREENRAEFTAALAKALPRQLEPSLAGEKLRVTIEANGAETASSLGQRISMPSANFMLSCGEAQTRFTVTFSLKTAVALTDRLFGGTGSEPDEDVEELPQSARLVLEQLAQGIAAALVDAGEGNGPSSVASHHASFARLEAFPKGDYCLSWIIKVQQEAAQDWQMQIAAREADIDALLGNRGKASPSGSDRPINSPTDAPFGDIPLPLRAVLTEFPLSLSKLSALKPDDVIPVSLARKIPLQVGARILGHGDVGTQEDRIALRLIRPIQKDITE